MKFFVTGNETIKTGLDLNFITPADSQGSNFASKGQTLQQSFSVAENVFNLVERGTINFVLIGLAPDVLFRDENGDFTKGAFDKNIWTLKAYIKLCLDNGAKPVAVILPTAPSVSEYYRYFFNSLLDILSKLEQIYDLKVMNFLRFNLAEKFFVDETHLTADGVTITSSALTYELNNMQIFPEADFCQMSYRYFYAISHFIGKENFHAVMNKVFSYTLSKLRRRRKIKVAFVTDHAATWCGDKLYNLFAKNRHFVTTVFLCRGNESTLQDTQHDVEQFKSAGINVVGVFDKNEETPPQDIIFFLRPYTHELSKSFQFDLLTPQTLICYIPYGIETSAVSWAYALPIFRIAWKHFFDLEIGINLFENNCAVGIPRGVVSGAPKLDFFFDDTSKIKFPWKMARPNAKKIIWAPHFSFAKEKSSENYATFAWNYRFMYEFAKAHPETSWIVKPHPRLMLSAIEGKLFPSVEAYEEYLHKWNDLPNAQVYTGGYYQAIFATSDGMIHDSRSFIAEYQYTHKPMIYLLNNATESFTDIGRKILNVSYIIDGKNLNSIAAGIKNIFIEGNDPLKDERRKVFDECLNYRKLNGMSASDFIFKAVAAELQII